MAGILTLAISRRRLLLGLGAAGVVAGVPALIRLSKKSLAIIPGKFVFESERQGHRIRDRAAFARPKRSERHEVVIIGGGIAGLSAAWRFKKRGFTDFVLLEMEARAGGNARWGENDVTAYPWAAHYVPVPDKGAPLVRELFEDLGVLRDGVWDEKTLCHSPKERLHIYGRWQPELEPEVGTTAADAAEFQRFYLLMDEYRQRGWFTIPSEDGLLRAGDEAVKLDRVPMAEWLAGRGFRSPYLLWYVDYCCRDDYGALAADTSAFAGIHYFAVRPPHEQGPLTWSEGNGWVVKRLVERMRTHLRPSSMVHRVERVGSRVSVWTEECVYEARRVIFAAPTFLAPHVVDGAPRPEHFVYSPWLTANLSLDRRPHDTGAEPAWDNVLYDSLSLGYVDATHQSLRNRLERTVWTYYWALAHGDAAQQRQRLTWHSWGWWAEKILGDLERAHRDIRQCVGRLDIYRIGHAMIRPYPGFLTSDVRRNWRDGAGAVVYANSDLSGIPIFEEAQHHGVGAAERVLREIGN
jgi:phytoene dehydrogenase-like protein